MERRLEFSSDEDGVFNMEMEKAPSPAHTRSGVVYTNSGRPRQRSKIRRKQKAEVSQATIDNEAGDELTDSDNEERFIHSRPMFRTPRVHSIIDIQSSPVNSRRDVSFRSSPPPSNPPLMGVACSSPPASNFDNLNILDSPNTACALSAPRVAPFLSRSIPKLVFEDALPNSIPSRLSASVKANVNPFTPENVEGRKRNYDTDVWSSVDGSQGESTADDETFDESLAKRIKVSEINVRRFSEEYVDLGNLSSGNFGKVVKAKHRLDGMTYAIKVTKRPLRPNSRDERLGMKEVFAYAAMTKHKHIVRYFSSWVEGGKIFIQNEFCEGGSLDVKLDQCRVMNSHFSEEEIRKILSHVGRGLKYLHKRKLVHLDIKPANILLAFCGEESPSHQNSPDSGALSAENHCLPCDDYSLGQTSINIRYKLGDLGHLVSLRDVEEGKVVPEEGDCRYMAPEFLRMSGVPHGELPKADLFSTGMTAFEAASLTQLPKNSEESRIYENLQRGKLPYLDRYSTGMNSLLRSLVHPDPSNRPSASSLVQNLSVDPLSKSRVQTRNLKRLDIGISNPRNWSNAIKPSLAQDFATNSIEKKLVGKGVRRSRSTCF